MRFGGEAPGLHIQNVQALQYPKQNEEFQKQMQYVTNIR